MKKLYEEALSEKTKYPHISWKCAYIIAKGRSYYAKRHYNICYGSEAKARGLKHPKFWGFWVL